jgi:hypothetical protein
MELAAVGIIAGPDTGMYTISVFGAAGEAVGTGVVTNVVVGDVVVGVVVGAATTLEDGLPPPPHPAAVAASRPTAARLSFRFADPMKNSRIPLP